MCDSAGNALPAAADGSQADGTPCNKIPQSLINPIGQKLMNLYPLPNANNAALGYNYVSEPVRKLNETKFDIRMDENLSEKDTLFARFSYDQATSYVPGGAPGFAEQGPFASNQGIINHARNAADLGDAYFFARAGEPVQRRLQPHFRLHHLAGYRQLRFAVVGDSRRQPGRRKFRFDLGGNGRRLLVVGRSRLHTVRGRDECLDGLRFAGYGARPPRHPSGLRGSRQSVEHRCGRFPQRLLGRQRTLDGRSGRRPSDGSAQPGDPRSGVRWRQHRPPLETLPPLRAGRLADQ